MPIGARQSVAMTTDEKFSEINRIISTIRNIGDQNMIRSFILELCKRYIDKDRELHQIASPAVKAMNAFETEYITRIIKDMSLE